MPTAATVNSPKDSASSATDVDPNDCVGGSSSSSGSEPPQQQEERGEEGSGGASAAARRGKARRRFNVPFPEELGQILLNLASLCLEQKSGSYKGLPLHQRRPPAAPLGLARWPGAQWTSLQGSPINNVPREGGIVRFGSQIPLRVVNEVIASGEARPLASGGAAAARERATRAIPHTGELPRQIFVCKSRAIIQLRRISVKHCAVAKEARRSSPGASGAARRLGKACKEGKKKCRASLLTTPSKIAVLLLARLCTCIHLIVLLASRCTDRDSAVDSPPHPLHGLA